MHSRCQGGHSIDVGQQHRKPISHGSESSSEEQRERGVFCGLIIPFRWGGMSIDALVCEEGNSILKETGRMWSEWRMGVICPCFCTLISCRVLDVLNPLQTLGMGPNEGCITVVQSGGDKIMNNFSASERERMGRSLEMLRRWLKEVLQM